MPDRNSDSTASVSTGELSDATADANWNDATATTLQADVIGVDTTGALPWLSTPYEAEAETKTVPLPEMPPLPQLPNYDEADDDDGPVALPQQQVSQHWQELQPKRRVPLRPQRPRPPITSTSTLGPVSGTASIPQPGIRRHGERPARQRQPSTGQTRRDIRQGYRQGGGSPAVRRKANVGSAIWTVIVLFFVILWILGSVVGH